MHQFEKKHINETRKQTSAKNFFKMSCKYTQSMFYNYKICSNVINIRTYVELLCNLSKIDESVMQTTGTNFPIWCHQTTKTTSKCNTNFLVQSENFGPLPCERVSKPQRCVKQLKSSKVTRNATNRDKHINEASKQTFANNLFKMSCKYTQGMLFNWKICFNVINLPTYVDFLCNLSKINETLLQTTCINFPLWCQQITKTISKCNKDSFGPVCQLWSVNYNFMRDSKPQCCFQQHKSLKVTRIPTNRNKHKNEASKETFATNLFKISCKYTQGMLSNWKICFNVINIRTYDKRLCNLSKNNETVV